MADYPDWTRLFYLTGTTITIPVNIEASDVTIPVSIDASSVTVDVSMISLPYETHAENLLTNPGFETGDFTGWTQNNAAIVSAPAASVYKGTYSVGMLAAAGVEAYVFSTVAIPCYPGQRILVAAAMKADAGLDLSELAVNFYTAEDELLQRSDGTDYGGGYDWTPRVETFVVPDGAAFARVGALCQHTDGSKTCRVDSFVAVRFVQPVLDSSLNLAVNIVAQDIASLDINIAASAIAIDIVFTDQSVAVFDAAKWFAHEASQKFQSGTLGGAANTWRMVCQRTIPTSTTMFIVGISYGLWTQFAPDEVCYYLDVGGTYTTIGSSYRGDALSLDTPIRATAGQLVRLFVLVLAATSPVLDHVGSFWGYDEVT